MVLQVVSDSEDADRPRQGVYLETVETGCRIHGSRVFAHGSVLSAKQRARSASPRTLLCKLEKYLRFVHAFVLA